MSMNFLFGSVVAMVMVAILNFGCPTLGHPQLPYYKRYKAEIDKESRTLAVGLCILISLYIYIFFLILYKG